MGRPAPAARGGGPARPGGSTAGGQHHRARPRGRHPRRPAGGRPGHHRRHEPRRAGGGGRALGRVHAGVDGGRPPPGRRAARGARGRRPQHRRGAVRRLLPHRGRGDGAPWVGALRRPGLRRPGRGRQGRPPGPRHPSAAGRGRGCGGVHRRGALRRAHHPGVPRVHPRAGAPVAGRRPDARARRGAGGLHRHRHRALAHGLCAAGAGRRPRGGRPPLRPGGPLGLRPWPALRR